VTQLEGTGPGAESRPLTSAPTSCAPVSQERGGQSAWCLGKVLPQNAFLPCLRIPVVMDNLFYSLVP
jgi:hypothetical protein